MSEPNDTTRKDSADKWPAAVRGAAVVRAEITRRREAAGSQGRDGSSPHLSDEPDLGGDDVADGTGEFPLFEQEPDPLFEALAGEVRRVALLVVRDRAVPVVCVQLVVEVLVT